MDAEAASDAVKSERRWDIDWLRLLVVLMLVPYHTARIFDYDPFYVKNDQLTPALTYWFVRVGDAFAMQLLFLLSGAATWFALRRRSGRQYAKERLKRLLVPLIWGVLVLAPPNAYFALRNHSDYTGSFLDFYPRFFEISPEGIFLDFTGKFTLAHLWFIFLLFIFSLVALPFFLYLRNRESGRRLIGSLAALFARPVMIFLLAAPILAIWLLIGLYPNPLLGLAFYLIFFIYGYILIADERFGAALDRHRVIALILGPALYVVLGVIRANETMPEWLVTVYYRTLFPWLTAIAVLGYGKRTLNVAPRRGPSALFLKYFGEGSYAFYLIHQPVLAFIGFYVVQWSTSVLVKYWTIAVATFVVTSILYEVLVRRVNVMRFLFGMRTRREG